MQLESLPLDTAVMHPACWEASAMPTYMHPPHAVIFAHAPPPSDEPPAPASSAAPEDPLEPPLDPLPDPLEPPLDPLPDPLEPPLDPLPDPLAPLEPLLEPLEDPLLLELSLAAAASLPSSPVPFPKPPVLFDEHAASNPKMLPDAHTNLLILRIAVLPLDGSQIARTEAL